MIYRKLIFVIFISVIAVILFLPNFIIGHHLLPQTQINLGLDLKGGSHLLLEIDFDSYIKDQLETLTDSIKKELRDKKLGYKNFNTTDSEIQFNLKQDDEVDNVYKAVKSVDKEFKISNNNGRIRISYNNDKLKTMIDNVIDQSIEIIRMRIDSTGTTEPTIQKQGEKYILLQVPGIENPETLKRLLGKTAKLSFHLVMDSKQPDTIELIGEYQEKVVIQKKPIMSGDMLIDAQATFNNAVPAVSFVLNHIGSKIFAECTKNNSGRRLAIVLDEKVLSSPTINEPILGGKGVISGSFTVESASELALLLRAGALPTQLKIIEERTVGPSLGNDSIKAGIKAGIVGFIGVVIFMVWSYGLFGIFAIIALVFALLYIFAILSLMHATLTLPGISGIILTIGMAVDANVLIYERIREELKNGTSTLYALRQGFEAAFSTITDSNITTLIVAFLLYVFGSGPIKGFAVTLTVGIIASMFAAIVITKLLVDSWVQYAKPKKLVL